MDEQENPAVVQAIMRHSRTDMTLYYSHSCRKTKRAAQEKGASTFASGGNAGAGAGAEDDFSSKSVDWELVYNDELTARCGRLTQR